MQQPLTTGVLGLDAPRFYLTGRQPLRPGAVLLATVMAVSVLSGVLYGLSHNRSARLLRDSGDGGRPASAAAGGAPPDDDKDDPNQIDTIVLGDPADAPVPARRGNHVSPVHATILVRLPRFGDQVGLIPDSAAGRLLYGWLAAFNGGNAAALDEALQSVAPGDAAAAQMELRKATGGFNLVSAKEVQPGVLVFRLRDQTPLGTEVLGTLQMRTDSLLPAIASFSLRAVPAPVTPAEPGAAAQQ